MIVALGSTRSFPSHPLLSFMMVEVEIEVEVEGQIQVQVGGEDVPMRCGELLPARVGRWRCSWRPGLGSIETEFVLELMSRTEFLGSGLWSWRSGKSEEDYLLMFRAWARSPHVMLSLLVSSSYSSYLSPDA